MVVDSSAIVAIFQNEPEVRLFDGTIRAAESLSISVVSVVESTMVLESRIGATAGQDLDRYLERAGFIIQPVTVEQSDFARRAWRRYGRGNHPAALNLGDCFAYALARSRNEPLLYKGNDFSQTDVRSAI